MRLLVTAFILLFFCGEVWAESSTSDGNSKAVPVILSNGDFSGLKLVVSKARVKDVVDGVTMVIENGRGETATLRLASIWVPWETPQDAGQTMKQAHEALAKHFKGEMVKVYQPKNPRQAELSTSLGHTLAVVERMDGIWAQGMLLSLGLAYVSVNAPFKTITPQLNALEAKARTDKLGLWGDSKWGELQASDAKFAKGQFRVVRGKVYSTFSKNNRIYLTFGPDVREDLTLVIAADKRLAFARESVNVMGLNSKTIEARGFITDLDGPVLVIENVDDLKLDLGV